MCFPFDLWLKSKTDFEKFRPVILDYSVFSSKMEHILSFGALLHIFLYCGNTVKSLTYQTELYRTTS